MRISDWSSDVCSSDLHKGQVVPQPGHGHEEGLLIGQIALPAIHDGNASIRRQPLRHMGIERVSEVKPPEHWIGALQLVAQASGGDHSHSSAFNRLDLRSEEHTSELQSLMRISYAVFCLKKKKTHKTKHKHLRYTSISPDALKLDVNNTH